MMWWTKKSEIPQLLPQTVADLDIFVLEIAEEFNLPNTDDTYESIATAIMHVNPNISKAPKAFFAAQVQKSIANKAAFEKLREFNAARKALELAKKAAEVPPSEPKTEGPSI